MAKGQTKQATNMSTDIYNRSPQVFSPVSGPLSTAPSEALFGYQNIQRTGGYDPNQLAKLRGGYENLYETGGMTPEEKAQFVNAATSDAASVYSSVSDLEQRKRAAQGQGMGGGEYAELGRLSEQAQAEAALKARSELQRIEAANKEAGLAGLGTTEASYAAGSRAGTAGIAGLDQQLLQALGLQIGSQEEANAIMANLSKNPGLFGNIIAALGTVTGSYKSAPEGSTWAVGA